MDAMNSNYVNRSSYLRDLRRSIWLSRFVDVGDRVPNTGSNLGPAHLSRPFPQPHISRLFHQQIILRLLARICLSLR